MSTTNLKPILQDSAHYFPQGLIRFCRELGLKLERPSQSELDQQASFFRHWFGYDMPQELNLFYHLSSQAEIPNFFFKKKFTQANPLPTWETWENSGQNPALQGILEHQGYYPRTHLPHWFYGFMPLTAPNFSNQAYYQEYAYHVQTQMGEKQGQVFGLSERKPQQNPYAESVHSIRPQTFAANLNDLLQALHLLYTRWTVHKIELDDFFSIWNEDTKQKVNFDYYMFSDMRYVKDGRTNWWYPNSTASHLKPNEDIRNYMQHNLWIVSWLTGEVPVSQITDQIKLYKHDLIYQAFQNKNNPPQMLHGLWAQFLLQGPHLKDYLNQAKKQPSALVRYHAELIEMLHQGQLNELGFRLNVQADLEAFDKYRHITTLRAEIS